MFKNYSDINGKDVNNILLVSSVFEQLFPDDLSEEMNNEIQNFFLL